MIIYLNFYNLENRLFLIVSFLHKQFASFSGGKHIGTFKPILKLQYLQHYWSDKGFKGTVVNWHCYNVLKAAWAYAYLMPYLTNFYQMCYWKKLNFKKTSP